MQVNPHSLQGGCKNHQSIVCWYRADVGST